MNPFIYGKIVVDANFCPRNRLSSELEDCIEAGQNLVVFGRRRVGKSSLVLNACNRFPKRRMLLVDLFFTKDAAMFLEYCSNALFSFNQHRKGLLEKGIVALKRISPRIEVDPDTGTPSLSIGVVRSEASVLLNTIDDFFDFLGTEFGPSELVVCFDEFQSVLNYPEAAVLMAKIRGKIQYHSFPYLFTGSDRSGLKTIFSLPRSPFYKSVRPLEVATIPRNDFQPFLQAKFAQGKRTVLPSVWDEIFALKVPGDIQQLCASLWESSDPGGEIDPSALRQACDRIYAQEIEGFRSLLGGLTALQLRVLKSIARNGTEKLYSLQSQQTIGASSSSIRRSLNALKDKWILVEEENGLYFNNPFLRQYLLQRNI